MPFGISNFPRATFHPLRCFNILAYTKHGNSMDHSYILSTFSLIAFDCFSQTLDLSYNNLSSSDVLALGQLPNLRILNLSGNQLRSLPLAISSPRSAPVPTNRSHTLATPPASRVAPSLVDENVAAPVDADADAQVLDDHLVNQIHSEQHSDTHDNSSSHSREPVK